MERLTLGALQRPHPWADPDNGHDVGQVSAEEAQRLHSGNLREAVNLISEHARAPFTVILSSRRCNGLSTPATSPDLAVEHDRVDGEKRGTIPEHVADKKTLRLEALSSDHEKQGAEHHRADEVATALQKRGATQAKPNQNRQEGGR